MQALVMSNICVPVVVVVAAVDLLVDLSVDK